MRLSSALSSAITWRASRFSRRLATEAVRSSSVASKASVPVSQPDAASDLNLAVKSRVVRRDMKNISITDSLLQDVIAEDASLSPKDRADLIQVSNFDNTSRKQFHIRRKEITSNLFKRSAADVGSPEVQIAMLTARINGMQDHFTVHRQDKNNRRGYETMWHRRRYLLRHLKKKHWPTYHRVVTELGIDELEQHMFGTLGYNKRISYPLTKDFWLSNLPAKLTDIPNGKVPGLPVTRRPKPTGSDKTMEDFERHESARKDNLKKAKLVARTLREKKEKDVESRRQKRIQAAKDAKASSIRTAVAKK